ncbi:hypothetical protein VM98_35560, partial [Streptomyces rubellomurinus subsp. indigoferus]
LGTAASLAFATGLHPDLIRPFLAHLLRSPRRLPPHARPLPRWPADAPPTAALPTPLLGLRPFPAWTASALALPAGSPPALTLALPPQPRPAAGR